MLLLLLLLLHFRLISFKKKSINAECQRNEWRLENGRFWKKNMNLGAYRKTKKGNYIRNSKSWRCRWFIFLTCKWIKQINKSIINNIILELQFLTIWFSYILFVTLLHAVSYNIILCIVLLIIIYYLLYYLRFFLFFVLFIKSSIAYRNWTDFISSNCIHSVWIINKATVLIKF